MTKRLTLSIIIPAYNEEHYIRSCLDSIATQTCMPDEVILVDNNSIDATAALARAYPFVRVIKESKQGRGHARTAGFNHSRCDIIGRIDADSVLAPDWCERIVAPFADSAVGGVTGLAKVALLPRLQRPRSVLWPWLYTQWSVMSNGFDLMWGANMAIRRSTWLEVRDQVCNDDRLVHEDQDVSFCVVECGARLVRDNKVLIYTDGQTFHYFPKLVYYTWLRHQTLNRHKHLLAYRTAFRPYGMIRRTVYYGLFPVVMVPFFLISALLWPIDVGIRTIGRTIFRST